MVRGIPGPQMRGTRGHLELASVLMPEREIQTSPTSDRAGCLHLKVLEEMQKEHGRSIL